ncbi:MAG TPA: PDZ domain-containing protein [Micromonosporaceae bacterium]|nr:PDZ domain-containing protein [Micromonosporaceae bacterium]
MQRRGLTVLVGAIIVALLAIGIFRAPVDYVTLGPGPTVNTLGTSDGHPVIDISGAPISTSAGQLRLVTVNVAPEPNLLGAISGWLNGEEAVVPRELIYPPDESEQQVNDRNAQDFKDSQTSAETSALRKLGYPVHVMVVETTDGMPAHGKLAKDDEITSVDGQPVTSTQKLQELIRAKPAGTTLTIGYTRSGQAATVPITTAKASDGSPRIGIQAENKQPHPSFTVKIDLDKIGGPSAGLMFSLGIIDKLDPTDLTGGKIVAGTGTIDDEGRVGPIGGIPQKLIAARDAKATIFLTPGDNCAEAVANAQPGLKLVKVTSLDDALAALAALREGNEPTLCSAT